MKIVSPRHHRHSDAQLLHLGHDRPLLLHRPDPADAHRYVRRFVRCPCVDGPCGSSAELMPLVGLQPCVRPVDAAHTAAGLDEVRDRVPNQTSALKRAWTLRAHLDPGSTGSSSRLSTLPPLAGPVDRQADLFRRHPRPCKSLRASAPPRRSGPSCWLVPRTPPGQACAQAAVSPMSCRGSPAAPA